MKIWILTLLVGCVVVAPSFEVHHRQTRNVARLLEDIIEKTGIRDLLPWLKEMIQTDPDAQRIVDYLNSGKFDAILDHLRNCPGYAEVKDKLAAEGVDLVHILEKVRNFITGKGDMYYKIQPRRTLGELLNEFIGRLDINRVIEVIKDKLDNDPDMKKVIEFVKGDTMKGIVECMKKSPEVQELKETLAEEGIDIESMVEMIKMLFGNGYYSIEPRTVGELLESLIKELGLRDLLPWIKEMIETDPDVQRIIEYLKSPAFKKFEDHLRSCPGYQEVKDKLKAEGVDLVEILEKIRNFITGGSYHAKVYYKIHPRRTLGELLDAILEKLDVNRMISIIKEKFHNNPDLKKVLDFLKGNTFHGIVECMRQSPDVQELVQKLKDEDVDVTSIIELIKSLLAQTYYNIEPRTVGEQLHNLIEELGLREMLPWIKEMIETYPDVQRVVEYLKSPALKRIEDHLRNCPGYQEVKDKLKAEGVDLVEILEKIRNFITGASYHAKVNDKGELPILRELLDVNIENLNINKMNSIINNLFHDYPVLKKVLDFLKSDTFHGIVECMRQSPDVQDLVQKLKDEGVDVAGIIELIKSLLAQHYYNIEPRTVGKLLHKLIEALGLKDLLPWIKEMIETDPDVQRVVEYFKSDAFKRIEDHLRNCPGYKEVKDKLKAEGVDLVEILEKIRNFITGGSYCVKPVFYYKTQPRRTLGELLDAILEKLNIKKMIAIIHEKFYGNPDLKKVLDFLKSDTFHGIVDCMRQSPDVQDLVQKLKDEGVDVAGIIELIKSVLAEHTYYSYSPRPVGSMLKKLFDELGFRDLIPWFKEMLETDPDVQRIIDYLRGPIFGRIEDHLRNCPGYPEVRDKLKEEDIDLVAILQHIRDFFTGGNFRYYKIQPCRTLAEILQELIERIDINRFTEVLHDKLVNDPDMMKMIEFVKGDTFKGIVDCMKQSKDVQDLIEKLADEGLDVPGLVEMIKSLLSGKHGKNPYITLRILLSLCKLFE